MSAMQMRSCREAGGRAKAGERWAWVSRSDGGGLQLPTTGCSRHRLNEGKWNDVLRFSSYGGFCPIMFTLFPSTPAQASVGRFVLGMNLVRFMDFISNLRTINKFLLVSTARAHGCKAFLPTCWVCLRGPCWGNEE